jgi:hypothetical protein
MLHTLLSTLKNNTSNDEYASRRKHPRRASDRCIAVIMGKSFPVSNWSPGGVLITADDRLFSNGQDIDFQLKFKLRNTILDIDHTGNVIRKGNGQVAIQFISLSQGLRKLFQQVMDDYVAREFANSQNT